MSSNLTQPEIQSIVHRENLVVRNLQITQGYYRISQGMRKFMGDTNASWCAFATHASKTAGQALRHELMPRILKSAMIRMAGFDNTFFYLHDVLGEGSKEETEANKGVLAEALKRVSLLISAGNVIVFMELAWPFTSLIKTFSRTWEYDQGKLDAFLKAHFRPGPLTAGGQDYLVEAFTAYYNARFETNQKRKAEYVLQGNLLIGVHEQTRLQPQIEQALAVPLDILRPGGPSGKAPGPASGGPKPRRSRPSISKQIITQAATQMMMSITLPSRELKLAQNVIAPTGVTSFPPDLLTIEDPRCRALVRHFETSRDTLTGSAADNWGSLKDRMSFVVAFFRSHQQYKRLFEQPFLDSQVPAIEAGHMPAGPL